MKLDITKWKEFTIGDLFDIKNGKGLTNAEIEENPGNIDCIQGGETQNGSIGQINKDYCNEKNYIVIDDMCLTVARVGTAGCVNFWEEPCAIGDKCKALLLIDSPTKNTYLFMQAILNQLSYKYSYGRGLVTEKYMTECIKLPTQHNPDGTPFIDPDKKYSEQGYVPDWQFMEDYIKSLHHKPLTTQNKSGCVSELQVEGWKEFKLNAVFTLRGGYYNKKPEHSISGKIPFLASTENNNGVTEYYSIEDIKQWDRVGVEDYTLGRKIYKGNCITVTVNGSVCNAFYQNMDFACSHDITAFYVNGCVMTSHLAEFLCTIIMQDKYRWSYGRKPHDVKKFGESIIKLPIQRNPDGTPFIDPNKKYSEQGYVPDWQFMEDYIKALHHKSLTRLGSWKKA